MGVESWVLKCERVERQTMETHAPLVTANLHQALFAYAAQLASDHDVEAIQRIIFDIWGVIFQEGVQRCSRRR